MILRYNLSPIRLVEKIRQFYLRPVVRRDRHNYFEPLNVTEVESRLNQLGVTLEPFVVDWPKFQEFRETFSGRFGRWNILSVRFYSHPIRTIASLMLEAGSRRILRLFAKNTDAQSMH